jgi:hypothetical protein
MYISYNAQCTVYIDNMYRTLLERKGLGVGKKKWKLQSGFFGGS